MYTPEGNKEVAKAVKALKGAIRFEIITSNVELATAVKSAIAVVARNYPEVTDTEPRDYICQKAIDLARAYGCKWFVTDRYLYLF